MCRTSRSLLPRRLESTVGILSDYTKGTTFGKDGDGVGIHCIKLYAILVF